MMKYLMVVLWVLMVAMAPAEKYYVTFVKGNVVIERGRKPLKVGDALNPDDKLIFLDQNARVSCISPGKGRFEINPKGGQSGAKGELLAVLKSSLIPASGTYHLSTRSLIFEGYDPKTYFHAAETGNRVLLINGEKLLIAPSYKMDGTSFFFLQYHVNGKNQVQKVPHTENALVFSRELLGGLEAGKVMLCYQSQSAQGARSRVVAEFIPVFADKAEIESQIKLIADNLHPQGDKKKFQSEVISHLFANYGKIGSEEINRITRM
jgi:hypothetical protein